MCDKQTMDRNELNKKKRRKREILKAMACEIEMHDMDDGSSDDHEPSAREHPAAVPHSETSVVDQGKTNNNGVQSAHEQEDRNNVDRDVREQEEEDRRSDTTVESAVSEQEDRSDRSESAAEQDQIGADENESAEEDEERTEYDELREWAIECNVSQKTLDKLLGILRRRLLPNLPKSSRTFLKTDSCPYFVNETQHGQFVYFGMESGLQAFIIDELHAQKDIFLQFNVDGMSIFKSSNKQFWPILCRVHCPQFDVYHPFIVACYCRDTKPDDMMKYFCDFIEEINNLQRQGVIIHRQRYRVNVKCFICDGPARALLKNVKCHGGYCACERCTVHGQRVNKNRGYCTVYPQVDKTIRTNKSFRSLDDAHHHNGISPLLDIDSPIDTVKVFLLDKLHLLDGGAMKKELEYWIGGDLKVRLGRRSRLELDRRITCLRSQIPREFQRKPRSTAYLAKWKCTDFKLFLLYIGPIVLKNILPDALYQHFVLLHVAARILCPEDWALKYNSYAKIYLGKYVLASRRLYGAHSHSLNTHNLIHVAIKKWKWKWSITYTSPQVSTTVSLLLQMRCERQKRSTPKVPC